MLVRLSHRSEPDRDEGRTRARIFGEQAISLYPGQSWASVESHISADWRSVRGSSALTWADVRGDVHAAWQVAKLRREGHLRDNAPIFDIAA